MTIIYDPLLSKHPFNVTRNRLLKRITAPSGEPLTLAETKLYLRIDDAMEDTLINDLITAARMSAENWLRRSLMSQTWMLSYDDGIEMETFLPMGPVNMINSIEVFEQDGDSQIINTELYWLNAAQNMLVTSQILTGFRVEVTYTAGYANAASVPQPIKMGMLAHIAALYDNRGDTLLSTLPEQVAGLYAPFREISL